MKTRRRSVGRFAGLVIATLPLFHATKTAQAATGHWSATTELGASVWDLFYDEGGTLWAGTGGSGIYKSTDDGTTWSRTAGLPPLAVWTVTQSPVNTSKYYAADNEHVYRSTDSGQSWSACSEFDQTDTVYDVAPLRCSNCQDVYAATDSGVWKSTNSGQDWSHSQIGIGPQPTLAVTTHPSAAATVWACTENGPYITTDSGEFWTLRATGLASLPHAVCTALAYNPSDSTRLYLGTWYGLFRSTDSGQNWERLTAVGNTEYVNDIKVLVGPTRSLLLVATDKGLYTADASQDSTWTKVRTTWKRSVTGRIRTVSPPEGAPITQEVVVTSGETVDLEISTDGGSGWSALGKVGQPDVFSLAVSPTSAATAYAVVGDRGNHWVSLYKTTNTGQTWTSLSLPADTRIGCVATDAAGNVYIAGGAPGGTSGVFQSLDGGTTWQILTGLPANGWRASDLTTQVGPTGGRLAVQIGFRTDSMPYGDTYTGTVGGNPQWTAVSPVAMGIPKFGPSALAVRGTQELWAAGMTYADPSIGTVVKSTNNGQQWQPTSASFSAECSSIAVDSAQGKVFVGTFGAGIFSSVDGGTTWLQSGGGAAATKKVTSIAIPRIAGLAKIWFAADFDGAYKSTDGGTSWTATGGLSSLSRPRVLAVSSGGNSVYAGLMGDGVWVYQEAP